MTPLLFLTCLGVTVAPGWSEPVLVTDSSNTERRVQFIHMSDQGEFHLVWAGYNDDDRIGYKMFDIDGNTIYPETMLSRDEHSLYLSTLEIDDSLHCFWREVDPVYTAARSLIDGSEELPATHLFTSFTWIPQIRACPDSLGRLHVLHNGGFEGKELFYEVWAPSPDSGFATEYVWTIEGVDTGGSILVDGNRVHIVAMDTLVHDYVYLQYDLEGNTVIPLTDFTTPDEIYSLVNFPNIVVDSSGNVLVVEYAYINPYEAILLWKIDCISGVSLLSEFPLVEPEFPDMDITSPTVVPTNSPNEFHLCWIGQTAENKIFHLVFDSDGNIIHEWQLAYDYSDEDPEDLLYIDGVSDSNGNLYIVYAQVETEPLVDYFPTFGWLDYSTLGIEGSASGDAGQCEFTVSQNPVTGLVTIRSTVSDLLQLKVYDMSGRKVSTITISDGIGFWNGEADSGERLPSSIYSIVDETGIVQRITLLDR